MATAFHPQPLQHLGFKYIRPTLEGSASYTPKDFSTSAGRTRSGSCTQTPKAVQLPTIENETYASQQLLESNEHLRTRLRNAESSVSFLTEHIHKLEMAEREHQSQLKEKELLLNEANEQLTVLTGKYRQLRKLVPQLMELREKQGEHQRIIAQLESQKDRLDDLCEKYCQELHQLRQNGSSTDRVVGENAELNQLVEQMRPQLKRLADVLEATNFKLQKFEHEKKQLTKELVLARMEKQSMMRLFDRINGQKSPANRQAVIVESYNELVIRWAQILEENEQLQLERVHFIEELVRLGWKGSNNCQPTLPSKKEPRVNIPLLNFQSAKCSTNPNQSCQQPQQSVSNHSLGRAELKIIDSEQSCQMLVTPGTVKRIGAIRCSMGKKPCN